jgi:hypothetical protein
MTGGVGNRSQHQRRRQRQLDRKRRKAEKSADAAIDAGQQRRKVGCRRLSRLRLDRADRQIQAFEDCGFDGAIEAGARRLRHHAQQAVDRLAGILGKPRGKVLALEQKEGALQGFLMLGRKRSLGRDRHHR